MGEETTKKEKLNFFKRLKLAIFKLEDYGTFLGERLTVAFKYFFIIVLLLSIIVAVAAAYDVSKMVNKVFDYVENELPEFSYENGMVSVDSYTEAYDWDYEFGLIIDTSDTISDDTLTEYENKINMGKYGLIALKDKIICISGTTIVEGKYEELQSEYDFSISNKQDLVNELNNFGRIPIIISYFFIEAITLYLSNIITILSHIFIIAIFGWIAAKICGVNFKMAPMIALAIYSLSLSIVLTAIYNVVYILTGFEVQYFDLIYLLIAYVYIIAAIFMIKYDLIKQTEELRKIIEVQQKVKDEQEENKEDEDGNSKENDKKEKSPEEKDKENSDENGENEENNEPDGSEI